MALLVGCSAGSGSKSGAITASADRLSEPHLQLQVESVSGVSSKASESASASIGSIYLESQIQPIKVNGVSIQASDVNTKAEQIYVAYSAIHVNGVVVKKGAIEQLKTYACDNPFTLLHVEYCIKSISTFAFPLRISLQAIVMGIFSMP